MDILRILVTILHITCTPSHPTHTNDTSLSPQSLVVWLPLQAGAVLAGSSIVLTDALRAF